MMFRDIPRRCFSLMNPSSSHIKHVQERMPYIFGNKLTNIMGVRENSRDSLRGAFIDEAEKSKEIKAGFSYAY